MSCVGGMATTLDHNRTRRMVGVWHVDWLFNTPGWRRGKLAEQKNHRRLSFPKIPSGLDSSSSCRKGSKFSADLHEANAPLVRCYAPWGSLFARKFSLLWRLGNSVRKQLNFLPKAEAPRSSRARKRRISLYLPVEQGNTRAETGSPMTASSANSLAVGISRQPRNANALQTFVTALNPI